MIWLHCRCEKPATNYTVYIHIGVLKFEVNVKGVLEKLQMLLSETTANDRAWNENEGKNMLSRKTQISKLKWTEKFEQRVGPSSWTIADECIRLK